MLAALMSYWTLKLDRVDWCGKPARLVPVVIIECALSLGLVVPVEHSMQHRI